MLVFRRKEKKFPVREKLRGCLHAPLNTEQPAVAPPLGIFD